MEVLTLHRLGKEIASEYSSDSPYKFDFGLDPSEPEPYYNSGSSTEKPLLGPTAGLVIKSTLTDRSIYRPDQKPVDLATDDNSCFMACLETLPFQEGAPPSRSAEEYTPTEVYHQLWLLLTGPLGLCN
jgi:hypothetical protein